MSTRCVIILKSITSAVMYGTLSKPGVCVTSRRMKDALRMWFLRGSFLLALGGPLILTSESIESHAMTRNAVGAPNPHQKTQRDPHHSLQASYHVTFLHLSPSVDQSRLSLESCKRLPADIKPPAGECKASTSSSAEKK